MVVQLYLTIVQFVSQHCLRRTLRLFHKYRDFKQTLIRYSDVKVDCPYIIKTRDQNTIRSPIALASFKCLNSDCSIIRTNVFESRDIAMLPPKVMMWNGTAYLPPVNQ